jgi:hypothetical protein
MTADILYQLSQPKFMVYNNSTKVVQKIYKMMEVLPEIPVINP